MTRIDKACTYSIALYVSEPGAELKSPATIINKFGLLRTALLLELLWLNWEMWKRISLYQHIIGRGRGKVLRRDEKKENYHLEEAAIAGHPGARYNLASLELKEQ